MSSRSSRSKTGGRTVPRRLISERRGYDRGLFEQRRRIYLLRHGAVRYFDDEGTPFPSGTVPLTEEGRGQAKAVGELLRDLSFDRVIVSRLRRTQETAAIALEGRGYEPEQAELLSEIRT